MILEALKLGARDGSIRLEAVTVVMATVGPAMLVHRSLTEGPKVPDEFLESVVDGVIMPAARP